MLDPETNAPATIADGSRSPSGSLPAMDARQLAVLAEWADGVRNQHLVLVRTSDGEYKLKDRKAENDQVILQVFTRDIVPDRLQPVSVTCTLPGGGGAIEVSQEFDALFWTESAVEKFLLPYYYSQRILTGDQMERVKKHLADREVCAFLHMPPSRPKVARRRELATVLDTVAILETVHEQGPIAGGGKKLIPAPLSSLL